MAHAEVSPNLEQSAIGTEGQHLKPPSAFWDALAPHHAAIEDNYLDRRSLRHILPGLRGRVLVVGAGQGLIVEAIRNHGLACDGIDLSVEMIRHAKARREIDVVQADARALPFAPGAFETIIYATGVLDFMADEALIQAILAEGRRVLAPGGNRFVAFYRMSLALEEFVIRLGLLHNHALAFKQTLESYRLSPLQTLAWVANGAGVGRLKAVTLLLRLWTRMTRQELAAAMKMQKIFHHPARATALIEAAPVTQPYRNEGEIRNLFTRLQIPLRRIETCRSCFIAQI